MTMAGAFVTYALAVVSLGQTMTGLQLLGGLGVVGGGLALVRAKAQVATPAAMEAEIP